MRVRMKTLYAGPAGVIHPGKECDISADAGQALISGGYADAVGMPEKVPGYEAAEIPAYERAVVTKRKPGRPPKLAVIQATRQVKAEREHANKAGRPRMNKEAEK